jgi:serine/threonine-protein kinase
MQLESAEDLIQAIRASGLFAPEQFQALVREVAPSGGDALAVLKHLIKTDRITRYQLKKILHGRSAELFIGPYVITDKLGSGGMGKVYRAREPTTGRALALKVVRPALVVNPTVRGRYAREVQAAGKLDHPNIVRVFDAGEADGKFYLAMEFVDGIDLARLMHDYGALQVAEACEYVRQAGLGLQHAHDRGFVHRDVKPSNIVVAGERHLPQATEPAVVKILDLGLARAIDPEDMVVPDLTRDHTVVGTPDYMAPEQAKNSKQVDPRADLYSLGCALYFLLTGQVPFPGTSVIEKILAHQTEPPPPLQALRPDVPAAVAEIVARLMAKRPEDRIRSAGELAELLAPHARYPAGAPPVDVVFRTHAPTSVPPHAGSTPGESGAERNTLPSDPGSSVGSISPLGLLLPDRPGIEGPAPISPSDSTPRPHPPVPVSVAGGKVRTHKPLTGKHRNTRSRQARAVPPFVWIAIVFAGAALITLLLWLVSNA